jgi:hypothetical protein
LHFKHRSSPAEDDDDEEEEDEEDDDEEEGAKEGDMDAGDGNAAAISLPALSTGEDDEEDEEDDEVGATSAGATDVGSDACFSAILLAMIRKARSMFSVALAPLKHTQSLSMQRIVNSFFAMISSSDPLRLLKQCKQVDKCAAVVLCSPCTTIDDDDGCDCDCDCDAAENSDTGFMQRGTATNKGETAIRAANSLNPFSTLLIHC